jgi:hypothetical protein
MAMCRNGWHTAVDSDLPITPISKWEEKQIVMTGDIATNHSSPRARKNTGRTADADITNDAKDTMNVIDGLGGFTLT